MFILSDVSNGQISLVMRKSSNERIAGLHESGSVKPADVEYRVVWNDGEKEWNVFRNGIATGIAARKKKKSAVDSAIRDAKAEFQSSNVVIVVICIEGRKLETVWRSP